MTATAARPAGSRSIGAEDAARVLSGIPAGSRLADLLVHCLLAPSQPRSRVDLDVLAALSWMEPMVPRYTTSPVQIRSLANQRGLRVDVRRTDEGWSSVAWWPGCSGAGDAVKVGGAASEALSICAGAIAVLSQTDRPQG